MLFLPRVAFMASGMGKFKAVGEYWRLLIYTAFLCVTSPIMFELLVFAWNDRPWGYARYLLQGFINMTGVPAAVPYVVGVSFYVGLALSLLVDSYKRFEGVLFWSALVIGSTLVLSRDTELIGVFVENFTLEGLIVILPFVLLGMFVAGVRSEHLDRLWKKLAYSAVDYEPGKVSEDNPNEPIDLRGKKRGPGPIPVRIPFLYRGQVGPLRASPPLIILAVTFLVVGYGIVEALVAYLPSIALTPGGITSRAGGLAVQSVSVGENGSGLIASVIFLIALALFTAYERGLKVMQIGPARSGKSAEFGGLQAALESERGADFREATGMSDIRKNIANNEFPPPTGNEEFRSLELKATSGELFPEEISIQAVDYGGALLSSVLVGVDSDGSPEDKDLDISGSAGSWAEAKKEIEDLSGNLKEDGDPADGIGEQVPSAIWDCVRHADRIVLTVPLDDFLGPIVARNNERDYAGVVRADDYDDDDLKDALDISEEENIPPESKFTYDGETFYLPQDGVRDDPDDYVVWYDALLSDNRFDDTDFIVAVTKADHAIHDWRGQTSSKSAVKHYEEFTEHVDEEVLSEAHGLLKKDFNSGDIFPVWYEVEQKENEDEDGSNLRIKENTPKLRGSRELLNRLE